MWKVESTDIKANSPNWDRGGRLWQAKCTDGEEVTFKIDDDEFWKHVEQKGIKPDINDSMKVQWAYPKYNSRYAKKRNRVKVLKVLSFNGKNISKPFNDNELISLLHDYSHVENDQGEL